MMATKATRQEDQSGDRGKAEGGSGERSYALKGVPEQGPEAPLGLSHSPFQVVVFDPLRLEPYPREDALENRLYSVTKRIASTICLLMSR